MNDSASDETEQTGTASPTSGHAGRPLSPDWENSAVAGAVGPRRVQ